MKKIVFTKITIMKKIYTSKQPERNKQKGYFLGLQVIFPLTCQQHFALFY